MAKNSHIEWTNHTFNPWWGCHKVSPACDNCYAESWAKRVGKTVWGLDAPRRFFGDPHWREPIQWNQDAAATGIRARVFCASMADVFEDRATLHPERTRLWKLIDQTPYLDWLLLTKRPQHILSMTPWDHDWPPNVWIGTSIETQKLAELRLPYLLSVPAAVRFLSCEPLLGPLDLRSWFNRAAYKPIDWVIVGGESGVHSRPMHPDWATELLRQCLSADVPFHFKQWGHWMPTDSDGITEPKNMAMVGDRNPVPMKAVGKKLAGRTLDGTTWNSFPRPPAHLNNSQLHQFRGEIKSAMSKGKDREHFEDYREQTQVKHRQALLKLEKDGKIEVLDKTGSNVVSVNARRKFRGKATLAKD